jgi:8-oxo-dGTP pyrophosphatase MutT (NUDIX family)
MDIGETLKETAIREVFEETGIHITEDHISLLAISESVFPVLLSHGPPVQIIVSYFSTLFSVLCFC